LFRSLVGSLILHESIETTQTKASAIKGLVDTLIVKSKQKSESSKKIVNAYLPQSTLVKKLTEEIAPRYTDRNSGFTSTVKLGRRLGDGAMVVRMSLVEADKLKKSTKSESANVSEAEVEAVKVEEVEAKPKRSARSKKETK